MPIINPWEHAKPNTKEEKQALVKLLASILKALVTRASGSAINKNTVFYLQQAPEISIEAYLQRFVDFAELEETELICHLILIDRYIKKSNQSFNAFNSHRLIAAALVVAQKTYSDSYFTMTHYGKIAGVPLKQINTLEVELLYTLDFKLFITPEEYILYKENLVEHARALEKTGEGPFDIKLSDEEIAFKRLGSSGAAPTSPQQKPEEAEAKKPQEATGSKAKEEAVAGNTVQVKPVKSPKPPVSDKSSKQSDTNNKAVKESSSYNPRFMSKSKLEKAPIPGAGDESGYQRTQKLG